MALFQRTFFLFELVIVGSVTFPVKEIAPGIEKPYVSWMPSKITKNEGLKTKDALKGNIIKLLAHGFHGIDITGHYYDLPLIADAITVSGIRRRNLFITSKVSASSPERLSDWIDETLALVNTGYLDLLLLGGGEGSGGCVNNCREQWKMLERYVLAGKVKAIGVSNFDKAQLIDVMDDATVPVALNQVEYNVQTHNEDTIKFCDALNITVEAASPLGGSLESEQAATEEQAVTAIANRHGVSAAQVALRWILQRGHTAVLLPKSIAGLSRDTDVWSFTLEDLEVEVLTALHEKSSLQGTRVPRRVWMEL